ncbi:MAG TPA: phosphoribosylaminoimidazolesuccinocarboxamide synthase [Methylomirabilota bacterium]|nr:phosphoribosylaminoimidazolesuccinocarboxamide synthase [Methylomirabilota bacterium]
MLTADRFVRSGKVRDLYTMADGRLLLVASDRLSAFDVVLPTEIPDKGRVLTGLSRFWFAETAGILPNHLLETDVDILAIAEYPPDWPGGRVGSHADWRGRVMICRNASVVPVEAVVRGYLAGSGWKEYREHGTVCGIPLPPGLRESDRLPEPIFTPATKAEQGEHDENIDFDTMIEHIARADGFSSETAGALAEVVRDRSIALYRYAAAIAARAGILLADTKFEFGLAGEHEDGDDLPGEEQLILIDEALTPDSSRFWDAAAYEPGRPQASFDKQFVRDWLEAQPWDKTAPGPALPDDVVAGTRARYVEAYERITGASFERYLAEDVIAR